MGGRRQGFSCCLFSCCCLLLMMCGRQNQSGAHKHKRIVATNHVLPLPTPSPNGRVYVCVCVCYNICPDWSLRPSFLLFFSCSYVNYCLSPCCSLLHCHFSLYFSFYFFGRALFLNTHTHTYTHEHTQTLTLYTLVPSCILLHIPHPLVSYCYLKTEPSKTLRRIKVATYLFGLLPALFLSITVSLPLSFSLFLSLL